MDIYDLTQLITEPTRVTQHSRTLIDLCLTNSPDKISNSGVVDLGISDHCAIFLTRKISHFRSFVHRTAEVRQLRNFNEDEFLRDLRMNEWNCRDIALHGHATGRMNIYIFRRLRRQRIHTWRQSSSHNKQPF